MRRIIDFKIGELLLTKEMVLVDYDKIPILFVCVDDDSNYWMCYLTDCTKQPSSYYLVFLGIEELADILNQKIGMREFFTSGESFIEVTCPDGNASNDIWEYRDISEIDESVLPIPNAYFSCVTEELIQYKNQVNRLISEEVS